ncbi:MAG: hypothetical protein HFI37_06075 [Lachnospiraceae bacterium]|jgi:hypothetical protein|nr:hypothetical protein [Lachnospiraceae bacterium]
MNFNPNELILEKIRAVEEYDPATNELTGRYTQIEEPSLKTSAEAMDVTDAMGSTIQTFYHAQKGTFDFSNSLFSLDLAASQYGSKKRMATDEDKLVMPVSEVITIGADHTAVLKYTPVGAAGAEVKYVKVINENNTFGKTYEVSATAGDDKFTINAATKTITLPDDVTGRVFVNYEKETSSAVQIAKRTDSVPEVKTLLIHAIFHDPCNKNLVYAGVIRCPRAQIDPSSTEISLKADGKHAASYVLNKEYCSEDSKLFDILVSED